MGSGVAGATKRAGGEEIEREAVAQGPIAVGEAVVTGAGRLPHKAVIHAAAMGYDELGSMIPATRESVYAATRAALARCQERELRSVAFPALGTGVGGLDLDTCAEAMLRAVRDHAAGSARFPERIVFVVRTEEAAEAFRQAAARAGLG
jgi:O-acetyl-ADP-ribose deacetylase (regulator of RNase III)